MLRLMGVLAGFYPIVAHIGVWTAHPRIAVSYLIGLVLLVLLYPPRYLEPKNILISSVVLICVMLLVFFDLDFLLIYLPPILIPGTLLMLFLESLRHGGTPLITQFAVIIEGDLDDERKVYTRHVTQLWAGTFAFMVLEGITLAIWSPIEIWSWFTYIGNYVLIALLLIIEFLYRKYRFKSENIKFKQFITALTKHHWK